MTLIHVIPELRAVHVERYASWAPDDILFFHNVKWDLAGQPLPAQAQPFTISSYIRELRRHTSARIEIPEPLWVREVFRTFVTIAATRAFSRKSRLFAYCIENNDIEALVGAGRWRIGRILTRIFAFAVGFLTIRNLNGMVFGSRGAELTYSSLPFTGKVARTTIPELPRRDEARVGQDTVGALFVGRLEDRKGILLLMRAWELIEDSVEGTVTIVGSGPHLASAQAWAAHRPSRRSVLPAVAHSEIGEMYLGHRVLVAPSVRWGRWREQIGLPIKEALSHGLTVVTSSETGLASWLASQGHTVIKNLGVTTLAEGLRSALSNPLQPDDVVARLPATDGRYDADQWMRSYE